VLSDPVFEAVETWCSLKRSRQVVLSLRVESSPKNRVITGFAVSCDCEFGCDKGFHCLLGKRIMTRRKRK
jgi:hypothetical protein